MFVMCGRLDDVNDNLDRKMTFRPRLSEDPTVQESFECVFSSQLEQGLEHEGLWEEDELSAIPKSPTLMSPALLHQTFRELSASIDILPSNHTDDETSQNLSHWIVSSHWNLRSTE
jgi:hypothetical protein